MTSAVAVLRGDVGVSGIVKFEQSSPNDAVKVFYEITGNSPNALKGFHIHQFGDNSNGCISAGPHFNPSKSTHGAPENVEAERHAGDLGNIKTDAQGVAKGELSDKLISLFGDHSIIGRTVIVHAGEDDLGKGGDEESLKTGNAGGRAACGVIGLSA
ncbi:Superoxide dismutase [Cu-Zn] [Hanseniaspora guilliermondii]